MMSKGITHQVREEHPYLLADLLTTLAREREIYSKVKLKLRQEIMW